MHTTKLLGHKFGVLQGGNLSAFNSTRDFVTSLPLMNVESSQSNSTDPVITDASPETMATINTLSQGIATMSFIPKEPATMDILPEELLDQIMSYLIPDRRATTTADISSLSSLSRVSRKFYRVVKPHLYHTIPITLEKAERWVKVLVSRGGYRVEPDVLNFAIPTTEGCNAVALIRTLKAQPNLAEYVKALVVRRDDIGFKTRWTLGMYGYRSGSEFVLEWSDIELMTNSTVPLIHRDRLRRSALPDMSRKDLDPHYAELRQLLRLLPNIEYLDLSKYEFDAPSRAWMDLIPPRASDRMTPNNFAHVEKIVIAWHGYNASELWPLFGGDLPNLRSLEVDQAKFQRRTVADLTSKWRAIAGSSNVKHLTFTDIRLDEWMHLSKNTMDLMFQACIGLESLHLITDKEPYHPQFRAYLSASQYHITMTNTLRRLEIYHKKPFQFDIAFAGEYTQEMAAFRSSTGLEHITLDVDELIELLDETELEESKSRPIPGQLISFDGTVMRLFVDMTLPQTLQTISLRIGGVKTVRDGLFDAISKLSLDVPSRFPRLERLTLHWHRLDHLHMLSSSDERLHDKFAAAGVEFVEEYI